MRRRRRGLVVAAALAAGVGAAGGLACCGTIRITPPASVADPVAVYVADTGGTSKVVLPRFADGGDEPVGYAAYGFGEWAWYAERQEWLIGAPITIFVPTPGTLARREHGASPGGLAPERWLWAEEVHRVEVERAAAAALLARLDGVFDAADRRLVDEERALEFVPWDRSYWIGQQSSTMTASWCRELGCTTGGWTFRADFELVEGG